MHMRDRMMRSTLLVMLAMLCIMGSTGVHSKILVKHKFDVNPKKIENPESLEDLVLHRNAPDSHWKMQLRSCPGNRDVIDEKGYYKTCLFKKIDLCEPSLKKKFSCFRNEIGSPLPVRNMFDFGKEYWFGFSIYIPEDYKPDSLKTVYFQLHANGGGAFSPGGPMMALQSIWGRWALRISGSSQCTEAECNYETFFVEWLAPVVAGKWYDWVYHTKISKDWKSPGFAQMYLDGKLLFQRGSLMTAYKEEVGPYWKMGVYKHEWGNFNIWANHTFINTQWSAYFAALVIAEGSDRSNFDKVDTRPVAMNFKQTCVPCKNGVLNELFDEDKCEAMCEELKERKGSKDDKYQKFCKPKDCDDLESCCTPCTKNSSSRKYSKSKCKRKCRNAELKDRIDSKDFKKYCSGYTSYVGICDRPNSHGCNATTGANCFQDDGTETYHCRCDKTFIINKRNPLECIPYIPFGGDEPEEIVLGTYKNLWAKPNQDIYTNEFLEGKPFTQPTTTTTVPTTNTATTTTTAAENKGK